MRTRRSIRAFLDRPVDRATLERICTLARCAPSGANLQPGKFHVLTGQPLQLLKNHLLKAARKQQATEQEYSYFPRPMGRIYKERQREAACQLYSALGIERRDLIRRREQFARNYDFFGAPVGAVVTIDRDMGSGCFMDLGMAIMSFLLAVEDCGLGATGIGALANYGSVVHRELALPEAEMVVCGIAIGVADPDAAVNRFKTKRAALNEFAAFYGFDAYKESQ